MTRRLPSFVAQTGAAAPSWLIVAVLGITVTGTLAMSKATGEPEHRPAATTPPTPYETCLLAATTPGPSGFATEVCEPLSPLFEPGQYVYVGPDSWSHAGATVSVPSLAEQIADSCPDTPDDLLGCVRALIKGRQERAE